MPDVDYATPSEAVITTTALFFPHRDADSGTCGTLQLWSRRRRGRKIGSARPETRAARVGPRPRLGRLRDRPGA